MYDWCPPSSTDLYVNAERSCPEAWFVCVFGASGYPGNLSAPGCAQHGSPRVAGLRSTRCVLYDNPEAERNRFTFTGCTSAHGHAGRRDHGSAYDTSHVDGGMDLGVDMRSRSRDRRTCPALYISDNVLSPTPRAAGRPPVHAGYQATKQLEGPRPDRRAVLAPA